MVFFTKETLKFFRELKENNSSEWFQTEKNRYLEFAQEPALRFLEEGARMGQGVGLKLRELQKKSLFRLNRDVRFSSNKEPYKTHLGMVWSRSGQKNCPGGYYAHVEPGQSFWACGFWMPDAALTLQIRQLIFQNQKRFLQVLEEGKGLEKVSDVLDTDSPGLVRLPRGFESAKGSLVESFLKQKSWTLSEKVSDGVITGSKCGISFEEFLRRSKPFMEFFWKTIPALKEGSSSPRNQLRR
jgi:uncharacterized protein (TIGR02453 family)